MHIRIVCTFILMAMMGLAAGCGGKDPVAPAAPKPTPFSTETMPLTIPIATSSSGNLNFDNNGNLLIATRDGVVHRVAKSNGQVATIANGVGGGSRLMCAVYHAAQDRIYVGTAITTLDARIYSVNPADGSSALLIDLGDVGWIQQLKIIPSSFGTLPGRLMILTYNGNGTGIYTVDATNPGAALAFSAQSGTDMDFAPDGTLYVTDYAGGRVVTISSNGLAAEFATGISSPEGIAINSAGTKMFVASTNAPQQIYEVTMPGAVVTPFSQQVLQGGTFPTGMVYDSGNLIFLRGFGEMVLDFIDTDG